MTKGFPKTTLAILIGLVVACALFGFDVFKRQEWSLVAGFVMVPWLAWVRVGPNFYYSPILVPLFFWIGVGGIAYLAWTKRRVLYPAMLVVLSCLVLTAAWKQAIALLKN